MCVHYTGHTQKNGAVSEVINNLFLILHGHNIHYQQRQLSQFLMRYQQFASHAYCGSSIPRTIGSRGEGSMEGMEVGEEVPPPR
jgi:hypothetical protein